MAGVSSNNNNNHLAFLDRQNQPKSPRCEQTTISDFSQPKNRAGRPETETRAA
jgi:hypothetical protein